MRKEIDAAIASRQTPHIALSEQYGVSIDAIKRHRHHIQRVIDKAEQHQTIAIYDKLERLTNRALDIVETALEDKEERLKAVKVLTGYLLVFRSRFDRQPGADTPTQQIDADWIIYLDTRPDIKADYLAWLRSRQPALAVEAS